MRDCLRSESIRVMCCCAPPRPSFCADSESVIRIFLSRKLRLLSPISSFLVFLKNYCVQIKCNNFINLPYMGQQLISCKLDKGYPMVYELSYLDAKKNFDFFLVRVPPYVENWPKFFFIQIWQFIHHWIALVEFTRNQLFLESFILITGPKYPKNRILIS